MRMLMIVKIYANKNAVIRSYCGYRCSLPSVFDTFTQVIGSQNFILKNDVIYRKMYSHLIDFIAHLHLFAHII